MRNINTCSYASYTMQTILWTGIAFGEYLLFLFFPLPGIGQTISIGVLAVSVGMFMIGSIAITYETRRNHVSIAVNALGSLELYFVLSFRHVFSKAILLVGCAALAVAAVYGILVGNTYLHDRRGKTRYTPGECIKATLLSMRTLVVGILSLLMVAILAMPVLGLPLLSGKAAVEREVASPPSQEVQLNERNMQTLLLFRESKWAALDTQQRLDALQAIADLEAERLGIPTVDVTSDRLKEDTLGQYSETSRTITINLTYLLASGAEINLHTVTHEIYHAYENRLVLLYNSLDEEEQKLYLFRKTIAYKEEFIDYISGDEDYEAYAAQACEVDSNAYADARVAYYYQAIHQYHQTSS